MASFGVTLASSALGPSAFVVASCRPKRHDDMAVVAEDALVGSTLNRQVVASIAVDPAMLLRWRNGGVATLSVHDRFASATVVQALMGMASFGVGPAWPSPEVSAFVAAKVLLSVRLSLAVAVGAASPSLTPDDTGILWPRSPGRTPCRVSASSLLTVASRRWKCFTYLYTRMCLCHHTRRGRSIYRLCTVVCVLLTAGSLRVIDLRATLPSMGSIRLLLYIFVRRMAV